MILPNTLAGALYAEYCNAVGGVAFNGDPLPDWDTFSNDPGKRKQALAWIATALKAVEILAIIGDEPTTAHG